LTSLRHRYPILRRARFLNAEYNEELGVKNVTWINANGAEMQADDWADAAMKCFGMLMDGRAQVTGIRKRAQDATLLLVINSFSEVVDFRLPRARAAKGGRGWPIRMSLTMSRRRHSHSATPIRLPEDRCCCSSSSPTARIRRPERVPAGHTQLGTPYETVQMPELRPGTVFRKYRL
jgi:pullulanase/glycogen debranching enzyme